MTAPNTSVKYDEPSRDEIALTAFLAWEKEGRQPNRETYYWLQAEAQLREAAIKKAEAAAARAAKPWPPAAPAVKRTVPKPVAKLTTSVTRTTSLKKRAAAA
jgi:hypothetical protein